MDAIARRLRDAYPDANADTGVNIIGLHDQLTDASAQTLWILFGVVACVLAIACGNVATLFIARALGRSRELQVRAALGASRFRLIRQLFVESLLLAAIGAGLGVGLAWLLRPALIALLPAGTPRVASIEIDGPVIAFTLFIGVLTSLAAGVAPGVIAARNAELTGLRDTGRSGPSRRVAWVASVLMAAQLALAVVLVTGTGLMLRTLWTLYDRDPGIDVERLLTMEVTIPDFRSRGRAAAASDFQRMTERIAALPGVSGAGAVQALPFASRGPSANIRVEGRAFPPNEAPDIAWRTVTPGYFRAAGIPLLRGRAFTEADREGAPPVAIINATLASLLWPDTDPLGRRIGTGLDGNGAPVLIVGVAGDVPQEGISAPVLPEMYRPLAQPSRFLADAMSIVVRTDSDPAQLAPASRQAIREVHPQAPVTSIRPMSTVAAVGVSRELTAARALASFGALALLLAAVGLHGVMTRLVTDRTRELGIRLALGAEPRRVRWLVVGRTLQLASAGLAAGVAASMLMSRQLGALLHGVSGTDPLVVAGSTVVLLVVAMLASYIPARRASRVDPLVVMKSE
jgi:putative ABC transport system permease protein